MPKYATRKYAVPLLEYLDKNKIEKTKIQSKELQKQKFQTVYLENL